ncbi:hypothetical protein Cni_G13355 [Canna indica]|uniref:Reverse transcriptase n=1 Tax=Canna indica TaxID=4628 RepID=A0AAQ3QD08_9LILI|nr:hypothetical protein Cni_G13355 [Canna indica]
MKSLSNKAMALNRQLHIKWWTKARTTWLEENDKITKFFHNRAKYKKSRNYVSQISVNDKPVSDHSLIVKEFAKWYKNLWKKEGSTNACNVWDYAESLNWKRLNRHEKTNLSKEFSGEEIWNAVNSLGRGKSPGPDGFNVEFYIKYWHIVKSFIEIAFKEFENSSRLPDYWGDTSLVFVAKNSSPARISDYRPIALCNVLYKIISKVLVNRLKPA